MPRGERPRDRHDHRAGAVAADLAGLLVLDELRKVQPDAHLAGAHDVGDARIGGLLGIRAAIVASKPADISKALSIFCAVMTSPTSWRRRSPASRDDNPGFQMSRATMKRCGRCDTCGVTVLWRQIGPCARYRASARISRPVAATRSFDYRMPSSIVCYGEERRGNHEKRTLLLPDTMRDALGADGLGETGACPGRSRASSGCTCSIAATSTSRTHRASRRARAARATSRVTCYLIKHAKRLGAVRHRRRRPHRQDAGRPEERRRLLDASRRRSKASSPRSG